MTNATPTPARFAIAGREIGPGHPCYIIAELSANHQQDFTKAAELVRLAKAVGADAIKLQTYTPDTITIDCDNEYFRINSGTLWDGKNLHALYREAFTPWEWQPKLKALADEWGLHCFSSPFDFTAVDFLETLHVPAYKVASFELVDLPLIRKMAATKKPLIMSTGMANLAEIDEAVRTARDAGATQIALLKCSSAYPAPPEDIHLESIPFLARAFGVVAGLSDHTLGVAVPVAAAAIGANIIEKHFCLSRADPGPDSAFSLEPAEFEAMVTAVRIAERAVPGINFGVSEKQKSSAQFRRSLFAVRDIRAGEKFTADNVRSIRPANGLHTRHYDDILARTAARHIARGTPLSWDLIA